MSLKGIVKTFKGCFSDAAGGAAGWEAKRPRGPGEPPRIVFIGLSGAGKTSLVQLFVRRRRRAGRSTQPYAPGDEGTPVSRLVAPPPSSQPQAYNAALGEREFTAIDLPGRTRWLGEKKRQKKWAAEVAAADGVVFVVDSGDELRMPLVREELFALARALGYSGAPLLVLANKQDLRRAAVPGILADALGTGRIQSSLKLGFTVRGCSAKDKQGLNEAMTWLLDASQRCNGGAKESPPVWEV